MKHKQYIGTTQFRPLLPYTFLPIPTTKHSPSPHLLTRALVVSTNSTDSPSCARQTPLGKNKSLSTTRTDPSLGSYARSCPLQPHSSPSFTLSRRSNFKLESVMSSVPFHSSTKSLKKFIGMGQFFLDNNVSRVPVSTLTFRSPRELSATKSTLSSILLNTIPSGRPHKLSASSKSAITEQRCKF